MEYVGRIRPHDKLDPRFHPLGQPGPRVKLIPLWAHKVPYGLRVPLVVFVYCLIGWNARHFVYSQGPRTIQNVRIPCYDEKTMEDEWDLRFRQQESIYHYGHVYYGMQEKRIEEAKKNGLLPGDVSNSRPKPRTLLDDKITSPDISKF
ncbi:hypothetical protein RFI_30333 [Reticulomyxa filosa]|uniref:Uncharacterized protein n=1 Tax=Reticulomyxa filosa TaxID=46433 RepID=X6LZL8_RETFI|nr:hypothetical protein RFI_30333 [Reticulomyxa filosa]|eukprot:ETO07059.1 hypothetical protein RFI_30333 [Reticulomyxa filosa]